jgi:hypothetical protein
MILGIEILNGAAHFEALPGVKALKPRLSTEKNQSFFRNWQPKFDSCGLIWF